MSCMKKENMEWSATGLASVAPELATAATPPDVAVAPAGVATGAASLTGAAQNLLCQQEGLLRQQGRIWFRFSWYICWRSYCCSRNGRISNRHHVRIRSSDGSW
uniref:Uncharacterized protein n=1 Tax=Solanum tuberosum TaxID=4113 RepID=M1BTC2_SOLTU